MNAAGLRASYCYDPLTGVFTHRRSGKVAGSRNGIGYWLLSIQGRRYAAHRAAWLYMTGDWPTLNIDHINGQRADNRWSNLRQATISQNNMNRRCASATGFKGVRFASGRRKWEARLEKDGRCHWLGYFDTPEAAHAAYVEGARRHFGEFARAA